MRVKAKKEWTSQILCCSFCAGHTGQEFDGRLLKEGGKLLKKLPVQKRPDRARLRAGLSGFASLRVASR